MADVWIGYGAMLDRQAAAMRGSELWLHGHAAASFVAAAAGPPTDPGPLPLPLCPARSVLSRVHAAYAAAKERAERAEAQLAAAEAQLEQERASAEAHTVSWDAATVPLRMTIRD